MKKPEQRQKFADIYNKLREQYTDAEIAESFVFPSDHTPEEKELARQEFMALREKWDAERTPEGKITDAIWAISAKIRMRPDKKPRYDPNFSFPNLLKQYAAATSENQTAFGKAIGLEKTRVSKLVNGKVPPTLAILHRLAFHSGNIITARQWLRLHQRDQLQTMTVDHPEAAKAVKFVTPVVTTLKSKYTPLKKAVNMPTSQHKGNSTAAAPLSRNVAKAQGPKLADQVVSDPRPTKSAHQGKKPKTPS